MAKVDELKVREKKPFKFFFPTEMTQNVHAEIFFWLRQKKRY